MIGEMNMLNVNGIKKRYLSLAITILVVVLFASAGTYALFKWTSTNNPELTFGANLGIIYNKETDLLSGTLNPGDSKEDGLSTNIELWTTNDNTQVYGTLFLNVTNITEPLNTNGMLKWEVWTGATKINEGTFNGFTSGDILEVFKDEILNTSQTFYTIYIWLDDSMINTTSISGGTITAEIGASAGQLPASDTTITIVNNSASQDNYVQQYRINLTATSSAYDIKGYAITNSPQTPTEYIQIENPTTTYNFQHDVTENQKYYVWFRTQDNKIGYEMINVTCVDKEIPILAINGNLATQYVNSSSNITIPLKVTETISGINTSSFIASDLTLQAGGSNITATTKNLNYLATNNGVYTYNLELSGLSGNGVLTINAAAGSIVDLTGNGNAMTTLNPNVVVDNIAPTINNIDATQIADSINITVTASDNLSGVKTYYYSIDGTTYYGSNNPNYTFSNVSTGSYTAHVYAKDGAGNTSSITNASVAFDNIPPRLTSLNVTNAEGTYTAGSIINIVATFDEALYSSEGEALNSNTVPPLSIKFGDGTVRNATFASANDNTITYQVTITTSDLGILTLSSYSGTVYDLAGNSLVITTPTLGGSSISASTKAKINTTYYTTLANAISQSSTTKTIQMINNTAECVTVPSNNNITLDLNGKNITCNTANTSAITNNGILTITDTSTGGSVTSTYYAINNTGSLTLTSGTIRSTGNTAVYNNSTATNASGTSLYINGASVISTNGVGINNAQTGIVTIAEGSVKGTTSGIYNTTAGTINIGLSSQTISTNSPGIYSTGGSAYGVYMASGGTLNINNGAIYTSNTSVATAYYKGTATITARSGYHITSTTEGSNKKSNLVSGVTQIQWRSGSDYCDSYECCGTTTSTETSSCRYSSPGSGWTRQSGSCDSQTNVSGTCSCRGGYTGSKSCSSSWVTSSSSCMNWCDSMGASDTSSECSYSKSYAYYYTKTTTTDYCDTGQSSCSSGETSSCESWEVSWGSWGTTDKSGYSNCQKRTCNLDAEGKVTTCGSAGYC